MLQCLNDWRAGCSEAQLAEFEALLAMQCEKAISKTTINNRYSGSYHKALISQKVLQAASATDEGTEKFTLHTTATWTARMNVGIELTRHIAQQQDGFIAQNTCNSQEREAAELLLQRGVLFEHDGHFCLPAECIVELRSDSAQNDWFTLSCNTPKAMLQQLVPAAAQASMLKPNPSRNEMVAWLLVNGTQARAKHNIAEQLNALDWSLLLLLQQCDLDDFDSMLERYPDLPSIEVTHHYFYNNRQEFSPRKALEKHLPAQLIKLYRLGLIGIITFSGDNITAKITLCLEAEDALKAHWKKIRQRITAQLQEQWQATPCDAEYPSGWSMDQDMWRLWITLHFLPLGITQQGKLRKVDVKKIAALLHEQDLARIEFMIFCM
ncbi:hypothetical protein JYT48_02530, partial [Mariprofundus ferrooxydans]|nr:hypothetical protein [Mariprofundus ferrooxydans]